MNTVTLRVLGNVGLVVGQVILLFFSREIGLCIFIPSSLIRLPYFIENRYDDIVVLTFVNLAMNVLALVYPHLVRQD